jgi:CcmD family protein
MDSNLEFLFAGFAVFWAGLFVYIVLLQMRLRSLQQDIETLEERLGEADADEQTGTTESKTSTS